MKKILFICRSSSFGSLNAPANIGWAKDCLSDYDIQYWGKGFSEDLSFKSLSRTIDSFRPDFIYLTLRKKYKGWLPDLTSIKVPKIFVEVDSQKYNSKDEWYRQFDRILCREPSFGNWKKVPLFRWSVPEVSIPSSSELKNIKRKGIKLIGHCCGATYPVRKRLSRSLSDSVWFGKIKGAKYWESLKSSSALLCPTESVYGNFTPTKLFEFLASGAAVITNCDMKQAGIPELEEFVIKYNNEKDLNAKLSMDFSSYYNKAIPAMRNHTHRIRYKELFG